MSDRVLLNLLNEFRKKISSYRFSPNEFNKFYNTGARMQDLSYDTKLAFY